MSWFRRPPPPPAAPPPEQPPPPVEVPQTTQAIERAIWRVQTIRRALADDPAHQNRAYLEAEIQTFVEALAHRGFLPGENWLFGYLKPIPSGAW